MGLSLVSASRKRWLLATAVLLIVAAGFALFGSVHSARAHGALSAPISRVYGCFLEGPEHPQAPACQYAVSVGGTQPLYDWNEVHLLNANGQSRQLIPDGHLCSAGTAKYDSQDRLAFDCCAVRSALHFPIYRDRAPPWHILPLHHEKWL